MTELSKNPTIKSINGTFKLNFRPNTQQLNQLIAFLKEIYYTFKQLELSIDNLRTDSLARYFLTQQYTEIAYRKISSIPPTAGQGPRAAY